MIYIYGKVKREFKAVFALFSPIILSLTPNAKLRIGYKSGKPKYFFFMDLYFFGQNLGNKIKIELGKGQS